MVSCVRCGTRLYRFLIFATFLTLLNIVHPNFEQMVGQIYSAELEINKANSSDIKATFCDLDELHNFIKDI